MAGSISTDWYINRIDSMEYSCYIKKSRLNRIAGGPVLLGLNCVLTIDLCPFQVKASQPPSELDMRRL